MRKVIFIFLAVTSMAWTNHAFANSYSVECESNFNQYRECWIGEPIKEVILQMEYAPYECHETFSYGFEKLYMWVDRSCSGWFEVITESGNTVTVNK